MIKIIFHEYIRPAFGLLLILSLLLGLGYPLLVTGLGQALFPKQSAGSFLFYKDKPIGSELIGQNFSSPRYFWGRLSATTPFPYNAAASNATNYGANNPDLQKAVKERVKALGGPGKIPVDLVTASGSGLDPHISLAAAYYQIPRIAKARKMDELSLKQLIDRTAEGRQLGILGEPRVNVLKLNLTLDGKLPR